MDIIPGIFENDTQEIQRRIALVAPFVRWIQIDIADGKFVSASTPSNFPFLLNYPNTCFEAHLMVTNPETYVKRLVASGFKRLIAHVECHDPREFLAEARVYECEVGLALNVGTPLEEVEPFLEELDEILVMSVTAGASGQPFEEEAVEKIKVIHRNLPDLPIEVDGGINGETIKRVVEAGATRVISTSYLFNDEHAIQSALEQLESIGLS